MVENVLIRQTVELKLDTRALLHLAGLIDGSAAAVEQLIRNQSILIKVRNGQSVDGIFSWNQSGSKTIS